MAGGVVVHELRYRLAGIEAHDAAHAYVPWLQIVVATVVLGAVVEFGVRLRRLVGWREQTVGEPPPARVLWPVLTVALLVLVGGQEAAELRWLGDEHHGPQLFHELISDGGWLVAPLSLLLGGICALLLRGAAALARIFARKAPPHRSRGVRRRVVVRFGWRPVGDVLARRLAGRGPPLLVAC
jgi:hypothetical protein